MGIKKRITVKKQQRRKRKERRVKIVKKGVKPDDFYSESGVYFEPKQNIQE